MSYPDNPGHRRGSDTSRIAAESLKDANAQSDRILAALQDRGAQGMTADEVRRDLILRWPNLHNSNASARLAQLARQGLVVRTIHRRLSQAGRAQGVYALKEFVDPADTEPTQGIKRQFHIGKKTIDLLHNMFMTLQCGKTVYVMPTDTLHRELATLFTRREN